METKKIPAIVFPTMEVSEKTMIFVRFSRYYFRKITSQASRTSNLKYAMQFLDSHTQVQFLKIPPIR